MNLHKWSIQRYRNISDKYFKLFKERCTNLDWACKCFFFYRRFSKRRWVRLFRYPHCDSILLHRLFTLYFSNQDSIPWKRSLLWCKLSLEEGSNSLNSSFQAHQLIWIPPSDLVLQRVHNLYRFLFTLLPEKIEDIYLHTVNPS